MFVGIEGMFLAGLYGTLAASGLLLGASVALLTKPSRRTVALVMAFGAGTLLTAVTIDLCTEAYSLGGPVRLVLGFLAGGFLFVESAALVDERGGFLRREGTRARFLRLKNEERARRILDHLSKVQVLAALPPNEVQAIVPSVDERSFSANEYVFEEGDPGDALYLIVEGEAEILQRGHAIVRLGAGDAFGEMALLTNLPRNASVRANTQLETYRIAREDFNRLLARSPALEVAVQHLLSERIDARAPRDGARAKTWRKVAEAHLSRQLSLHEEKALIDEHAKSFVPLAIFVGAVLDGIPESVVIGATQVGASTPSMPLLIAVFLSNFPEAMSSAIGMTRAGFSPWRIMGMWGGLTAIAGVSAAFGQTVFAVLPRELIAIAESMAAGGILALLANTMMPEAFEVGGRRTAFATSAGFLTSFLVAMWR